MTSRPFTSIAGLMLIPVLLLADGRSAAAQQRPRIYFAEAPALLVRVEGPPVYRRIPGTDLERVINTGAVIVRDTAQLHYLRVLDGWMESYGLTGDWTVSGISPFRGNRVAERAVVGATAER